MDAFFDAAAAGDLEAVQRYMALPEVAANVATWNTNHRMRRLWNQFSTINQDPWFYSWDRDENVLRACVVQNGHVELLRWFFLPERVATMEDTMRSLLSQLAEAIVKCRDIPAGFAMFEVVAESPLFNEIIDDGERTKVMTEMMSVAALEGLNEWLRLLLSYGADPNGSSGWLLPIMAAYKKGDAETIEILLAHGASLDHENLLVYRGYGRWGDYMEMLVERGADVNALSSYYGSSLHNAVANCHEDKMMLLFRHFVDVDLRDSSGRTPLMVVRNSKDTVMKVRYNNLHVASLLLDHGANINAVDSSGRGILHVTIEKWDIELAQFFLGRGANPNCQDVNGRTPLIDLLNRTRGDARKHVAEFIDAMLEAGADPYLCDKEGIFPAQLLERNKTGQKFMEARPQFFNSQ